MNFEIWFHFHVGKNTCRGPCIQYACKSLLYTSRYRLAMVIRRKDINNNSPFIVQFTEFINMAGEIKQFLNQWCQKKSVQPAFEFRTTGAKHRQRFTCEVGELFGHLYSTSV